MLSSRDDIEIRGHNHSQAARFYLSFSRNKLQNKLLWFLFGRNEKKKKKKTKAFPARLMDLSIVESKDIPNTNIASLSWIFLGDGYQLNEG